MCLWQTRQTHPAGFDKEKGRPSESTIRNVGLLEGVLRSTPGATRCGSRSALASGCWTNTQRQAEAQGSFKPRRQSGSIHNSRFADYSTKRSSTYCGAFCTVPAITPPSEVDGIDMAYWDELGQVE